VVVRRTGEPVNMEPERDFYYDELLTLPVARLALGERAATEVMDAEDPLFCSTRRGPPASPRPSYTPTGATRSTWRRRSSTAST